MAVTIHLQGGLGNQLFQISAGIYLKEIRALDVQFNTDWYKEHQVDTERALETHELLRLLETREPQVAVDEPSTERQLPQQIERERFPGDKVLERVTGRTSDVYGFFQRVAYVEPIAVRLREYLSASESFSSLTTGLSVPSIGVHIRLGDYASNPHTSEFHGLTSNSFYLEAVKSQSVLSGLKEVVLYSDEPRMLYSLARDLENLGLTVAVANPEPAVSHLVQLSSHSHLVLSNSSFSWWAGWWAGTARGCRVVAPNRWIARYPGYDTEIHCADWVIMQREIQPQSRLWRFIKRSSKSRW